VTALRIVRGFPYSLSSDVTANVLVLFGFFCILKIYSKFYLYFGCRRLHFVGFIFDWLLSYVMQICCVVLMHELPTLSYHNYNIYKMRITHSGTLTIAIWTVPLATCLRLAQNHLWFLVSGVAMRTNVTNLFRYYFPATLKLAMADFGQ